MESNQIISASFDDMVFEGRNKNYGAYFLRQIYEKHVKRASIIAILASVAAISAPFIYNYIQSKLPQEAYKIEEVTLLDEPPSIDKTQPPPPPATPPPPLKSTVQFVPPVVKKDEDVPEEKVPTQEDLKDKDPGPKTEEGDPDGVDPGLSDDGDKGKAGEPEPQIYTYVEQMPEFDGGIEELYKYLGKNIKYPPMAQENDITGKVIVQFVVGVDGKISNVEVLKGIGFGCDEEAMRVIKNMPPWTPGKQNGKSVPVYYKLPVKFQLK